MVGQLVRFKLSENSEVMNAIIKEVKKSNNLLVVQLRNVELIEIEREQVIELWFIDEWYKNKTCKYSVKEEQ